MNVLPQPQCPVVRGHILLFQLLGYFVVSFDKKFIQFEFLLCGWSCLLLAAYTMVTVYTCASGIDFFFSGDMFGYFNDALKLLCGQLAIATNFVESMVKRKALRKFWMLYSILHASDKFYGRHSWTYNVRRNRRFLFIFYFAIFTELFGLFIFIVFGEFHRQLIIFWSIYWPFIFIIHLRNLEFIFHLEVIRLELRALQQELHLIVEYTEFARRVRVFTGYEEFLRHKLHTKQLNYQLIFEMSEQFQASFGLSTMAVLLMIYVRILVDTYFLYYTYFVGLPVMENLLIIPAVFEIPAFLLSSNSCMSMVKEIAYEVHTIKRPVEYTILSRQIQNFSLQILHQTIRFDGAGFPPLNGYMLTRIVGSITTYMIFFIQFMPKIRTIPIDEKQNF